MLSEYNPFNSWKCLLYRENFEAILSGKFLPPITLHIYPTNKCNAKCEFCIMKDEKNNHRAELNGDTFADIIDSANNMDIKSIHISGGGEPTLYSHLPMISQYKGYKVMSTNGAKLNVSNALLFDRIRVSLNAGNEETHKRIMGTNNWYGIWSNISDIVQSSATEIGIGFVLDTDNYNSLFDLVEICNTVGVSFIHIRPAFYPKGSEKDKQVRAMIDYRANEMNEIFRLSEVPVFAVSDKFKGFWSEKEYDHCLASPLHAVVTATGEMVVCQDVFERFGNLNENSLEEIWGSEEHKNAISKIDISKCPRCVMNRPNEVMKNVFIDNKILKELI